MKYNSFVLNLHVQDMLQANNIIEYKMLDAYAQAHRRYLPTFRRTGLFILFFFADDFVARE